MAEEEEEKEEEKKEEEDSKESPKEEEKPTKSAIETAAELVEQLKEANKKTAELQAKQEEIIATNMLSGVTEAGNRVLQKEPETDQEFAKRVELGEVNPLKEDGFI